MSFFKRIAEKVRNTAEKVKDGLGNVINPLWLPLMPFRPAMKKALQRKGVAPPQRLPELAAMFKRVIIDKKPAAQSFDYVEEVGMTIDPMTIGVVVKAIIAFMKNLAKKRKEKKASAEEEEILDLAGAGLEAAEDASAVGSGGGGGFRPDVGGGTRSPGILRTGERLTAPAPAPGGKNILLILAIAAAAYFVMNKD